jgi:hypothetical protein
MKVKVYHSIGQKFYTEEFDPSDFPSKFEWVADLEMEGNFSYIQERVFHDTNHINGDWTENESVVCVRKTKREGSFSHLEDPNRPRWISPRSTSVGDVIEINGIFFLCLSFGWEEFTPAAEKKMWICPECDSTVRTSDEDAAYNGVPYCTECDCEMDKF